MSLSELGREASTFHAGSSVVQRGQTGTEPLGSPRLPLSPLNDTPLLTRQPSALQRSNAHSISSSQAHDSPSFDFTGQRAPLGMKPRVTATLWEDEGTLCFQVDAKGVCVARREDNHMINGTKLLNVAGLTRGRRDGILKSEKTRHVVKIGPMHLKGVWIPFERALEFANKEEITGQLYPLFVHDIGALLYHPSNQKQETKGFYASSENRDLPSHDLTSLSHADSSTPTSLKRKDIEGRPGESGLTPSVPSLAHQKSHSDPFHHLPTPLTSGSLASLPSWSDTDTVNGAILRDQTNTHVSLLYTVPQSPTRYKNLGQHVTGAATLWKVHDVDGKACESKQVVMTKAEAADAPITTKTITRNQDEYTSSIRGTGADTWHGRTLADVGPVGSLFNAIMDILRLILVDLKTQPDMSKEHQSLESSSAALFFWGTDYHVPRGDLDENLQDSTELRDTCLMVLTSIGKLVSTDLIGLIGNKHQQESIVDASEILSCLGRALNVLGQEDLMVAQLDRDAASLCETLRSKIDTLITLGPSLDSPAEDDFDDEEPRTIEHVERHYPEQAYINSVAQKFPLAESAVINHLGKLNWDRYTHMLRLQHENTFQYLETTATEKARSVFHDSGVGTSVPAQSEASGSTYAPSMVSTRAESSHKRLPPLPPHARSGIPFTCEVCHKQVQIQRTRAWKKHVFSDILTYACFFTECPDSQLFFEDHSALMAHLELRHDLDVRKSAVICPLCLDFGTDNRDVLSLHFARHLEEIALIILPSGVESDDESSAESEASSVQSSHPSLARTSSLPSIPDDLKLAGTGTTIADNTWVTADDLAGFISPATVKKIRKQAADHFIGKNTEQEGEATAECERTTDKDKLRRSDYSEDKQPQDYQLQLMLLERQNKKRLLMVRQAQDDMKPLEPEERARPEADPGPSDPTLPKLPAGWLAQWDAPSKKYYYVQISTGMSQWELPTKPAPGANVEESQVIESEAEFDANGNHVLTLSDLEDLLK